MLDDEWDIKMMRVRDVKGKTKEIEKKKKKMELQDK